MGDPQLTPGSLFANRFEIQRAAGSGGMGTVYRALDRYSGDVVALKLLHSEAGGQDETERFAREAQLLSELCHPGIVSHVAHGRTPNGQRFLAMEWLEGWDLGAHLAHGPLPVRDCLRLLNQVADALSVAHQRGVIHRDIKPTNLFLLDGDIGRVKLLDFGLARRVAASSAMTRTGMIVGTPEYMAPEQVRGSRDLTPAADMFSLGCVLYECLVGQSPFAADHTAAVLVKILFEEPIPIETRRPGIPDTLLALLDFLLVKDPAQRVSDAAALRAALSGLEEVSEPSSVEKRAAVSALHTRSFSRKEQRLFSIVLAVPQGVDVDPGATQPETMLPLTDADRIALIQALTNLGGAPEFLADGSLLVSVPPFDSAQDQATIAARAALLIKDRWPESVVSMATGRGVAHGSTAVGEVVEQAASPLKLPPPTNSMRSTPGILIDSLSAKLLEGRFAQIQQPGRAVLLQEEHDADTSRLLLGKPTPCVGRESELAILGAQLTGCIEESAAQVTLITAAPGVGKSRLRHEFLRRVENRDEPITVVLGRGDMMSAGAPYAILRTAIRKLCGISGGEPLETQREYLQRRIAQHLDAAQKSRVVPFLGELCNVPFFAEGLPVLHTARQDPKIMRDCLRKAVLDFLSAECAAAPVLLVLDDLQWGDELSVSVIDDALSALARAPLFVLAFARPEIQEVFPNLWLRRRRQELWLKGLSKKACERLMVQILGKGVAADVIARTIEQSDGNALFLEELIRSIHEGTSNSGTDTVVAMLQARLGRMDVHLRQTARAASVFGQTFWHGGVAALLGNALSNAELQSSLEALVAAEFIQPHLQSRLPHEQEYGFRHALAREAAYGLFTSSDLQMGHRLAAAFLESAEEQDPSICGEHWEKGGEHSRAASAYAKAAELAMGQAALRSTLRYVERGLSCEPLGEARGVLRSIEGAACFWISAIERAFAAAMEALPLLPPGSGPYCRALSIICSAAIHGSEQAQAKLPEMLPLVLTIDPDREGRPHLLEGLSDLAASLCAVSPYDQVRMLISRLKALVAQADTEDPLLGRWLSVGECHAVHHHEPAPWKALQIGLRGIELSDQAGDRRTRLKLELLGRDLMMAELGDPDTPTRMRQTLQSDLIREEVVVGQLTRIILGLTLSVSADPVAQEEALCHAHDAMHTGAEVSLILGLGQMIVAQVKLQRGEDAELEARAALRWLERLALWLPSAQAVLIRALLARSRPTAALEIAEQGLGLLRQFGCVGFLEVELRLAISEAFDAASDRARAHVELGETLRQIRLRAADITDPFWKTSYLTRNPWCIRAQKLAREWGLDQAVGLQGMVSKHILFLSRS